MNKKILYVLIGACSILLGILCLFDRELPVLVCGIGLILYGIGGFFRWKERRKAGAASIWAGAGTFVAFAFGVFVLIGSRLGNAAIQFLLISLSIWLIAEGVLEILGAVMYRKAMTTADLGVQAPGSVSAMVLGIAMAAVGILGLIYPVVAVITAGIWIVAALILSGIRMIWIARSAGVLGESSE